MIDFMIFHFHFINYQCKNLEKLRILEFNAGKYILGKQLKDGKKPEPCKPILKVEFKTTRSG